MKICTS